MTALSEQPSLAELQLERARLGAAEAQHEFATALAATVKDKDLVAAGVAIRDMALADLAALAGRLAETIGAERDETRVHYLLSDAVHQLLDGIGQRADLTSRMLPVFGERFRRGVQPRALLTVSQHADRHRWIKSGTNAPGQWNTTLTPYLRDVMDDLSEHSPARTVVLMKATGVGGTEAMYNWIAYVMHHLGNRDMLIVVPTLELRDRSFNPRLTKMCNETPALADLVSRASRSAANRADLLEYGAMARIIKAGANSPDSLRSDHLPYVICDEVDAFPWDVGGEGDPMTLIENRQGTFTRAKTLLVSTPTKDAESRIAQEYARSDRRRYHVPCPHCGEYQPLRHAHLKYRTAIDEALPASGQHKVVTDAWYACPECGAEIREGEKTAMLARGRWIAERPHIKLVRGYHLNALYAPIGLGKTWKQYAQKWVDAQSDTSKLKAFCNTYLGETWKEEGEGADPVGILARVEHYTRQSLAEAGRILRITAGVDVQKDRIEASFYAFGAGEEAWAIDHLIIPGDTTSPEVWAALGEAIAKEKVGVACIDAGYNTSMVLAFCFGKRWAIPVKGIAGSGRPLIEDDRRRRQRLRATRRKGQPAEPLGVDQGKSLIYARLKMQKAGPGYLHFPVDASFDDEFFRQLAAEELRTRMRSGRPFAEWVQLRPRNEALDCAVYALAACRLAGPLVERTPAAYRAAETKSDAMPPDVIHGIHPEEAPALPAPRKKRDVVQRAGGMFSLRD